MVITLSQPSRTMSTYDKLYIIFSSDLFLLLAYRRDRIMDTYRKF